MSVNNNNDDDNNNNNHNNSLIIIADIRKDLRLLYKSLFANQL